MIFYDEFTKKNSFELFLRCFGLFYELFKSINKYFRFISTWNFIYLSQDEASNVINFLPTSEDKKKVNSLHIPARISFIS